MKAGHPVGVEPDRFTGLRTLAEALPDDAAVPVPKAWLLELLNAGSVEDIPQAPPADLTVAQVAARFGRKPSTVRGWVAAGQLPGAYHFRGRERRIPLAAIQAFEDRQRAAPPPTPKKKPRSRHREPEPDLGAWRQQAS